MAIIQESTKCTINMNSPWTQEHVIDGITIDDFVSIVRNCFISDVPINLIQSEFIISQLI